MKFQVEDMDELLVMWVTDLAKDNCINPVFTGYHNGQHGSYEKSPGYYRSIRFEKDDIEFCIDHHEGDQYNIFIRNTMTEEQYQWSNPTDITKVKELLDMMKPPVKFVVNYIKQQQI